MNLRANGINKILLGFVIFFFLATVIEGYFLTQKSGPKIKEDDALSLLEKKLLVPDVQERTWDPFEEFQKMQKRMDQIFEKDTLRLSESFPGLKSFSYGGPPSHNFSLKEGDDAYIVTLALPGLDEADLKVTVEEQSLRISGRIEKKEARKRDNSAFQSSQSEHFERYLTLPGPVKPESLKTSHKDGVLEITLQKNIS